MDNELLEAGYRAYTGEKLMSILIPVSASMQATACVEVQSSSILNVNPGSSLMKWM